MPLLCPVFEFLVRVLNAPSRCPYVQAMAIIMIVLIVNAGIGFVFAANIKVAYRSAWWWASDKCT